MDSASSAAPICSSIAGCKRWHGASNDADSEIARLLDLLEQQEKKRETHILIWANRKLCGNCHRVIVWNIGRPHWKTSDCLRHHVWILHHLLRLATSSPWPHLSVSKITASEDFPETNSEETGTCCIMAGLFIIWRRSEPTEQYDNVSKIQVCPRTKTSKIIPGNPNGLVTLCLIMSYTPKLSQTQYIMFIHFFNQENDDEPQSFWDTLPVFGHRMLVQHPCRPKQALASVSIPPFSGQTHLVGWLNINFDQFVPSIWMVWFYWSLKCFGYLWIVKKTSVFHVSVFLQQLQPPAASWDCWPYQPAAHQASWESHRAIHRLDLGQARSGHAAMLRSPSSSKGLHSHCLPLAQPPSNKTQQVSNRSSGNTKPKNRRSAMSFHLHPSTMSLYVYTLYWKHLPGSGTELVLEPLASASDLANGRNCND